MLGNKYIFCELYKIIYIYGYFHAKLTKKNNDTSDIYMFKYINLKN